MSAMGSVTDILWIVGGVAISVTLLTAAVCWIARERPTGDSSSADIPTARPLASRPIEPSATDNRPPPSGQDT